MSFPDASEYSGMCKQTWVKSQLRSFASLAGFTSRFLLSLSTTNDVDLILSGLKDETMRVFTLKTS